MWHSPHNRVSDPQPDKLLIPIFQLPTQPFSSYFSLTPKQITLFLCFSAKKKLNLQLKYDYTTQSILL